MADNKNFWKTVKLYLSDKLVKIDNDKIHLSENGELIKSESETAEVLNNFYIIKNLKILENENLNSNIKNIKYLVFRTILKYKTTQVSLKNIKFSFHEVNNE